MTTSLKLVASLAVAAASMLSLPSVAAELVDTGRSKTVKMWDLDLAKSADVQTLYERVQQAANDVCRTEVRQYRNDTRRPAPLGWMNRCVRDAVDAAVRDVGNRRLATLHTGGPRALL
jgi:UrcA family protein